MCGAGLYIILLSFYVHMCIDGVGKIISDMLEKVRTGLECFSKTKKYTLGNFSK